ncbi:MAG: GNAT family N-acetyltransferase, partial [Gemmatimonadetes bacterium]|nr:GNAT family N-acetyltransferase [Gemmatimonadota bacterium]
MPLRLASCEVRLWQRSDAESLARHANSRNVSRNLRDIFPYPYRLDDAYQFLSRAIAAEPQTAFAIVVGGRAVGGVGLV